MNDSDFKTLCAEAARILCSKETYVEADGFLLAIDGVDAILVFKHDIDPHRIAAYIDVGQPAEIDRGALCEHLLEYNLRMEDAESGVYGFEPESGRAIFLRHIHVDEAATPEELVEELKISVARSLPARQAIQFPDQSKNALAQLQAGTRINLYFA